MHPELDDDEIYVYGLSDKNLCLLEYNVILTQKKSQIKPIFLFLYVPKNKQSIENIKIIIYKIHYFLSFICDIEVVVLNKDHFNDQIDFIKSINNIKRSYEKTVDLKEDQKSLNSTNNQSNSDDFSSDGDDDVDLKDESFFHQYCLYNMNNFTENINLSYFKRYLNYILLVNDQSIKGDMKAISPLHFIAKCQICNDIFHSEKTCNNHRCQKYIETKHEMAILFLIKWISVKMISIESIESPILSYFCK